VLRIEDLDGPRVKAGADKELIEDLRWLGLDWDEDRFGVLYQRADLAPYRAALDLLRGMGLIYPCRCSRRQIERALSAPHVGDGEVRYPGTCRPTALNASKRFAANKQAEGTPPIADLQALSPPTAGGEFAWRLMAPDEVSEFEDMVSGRQSFNVQREIGDFVVATKAGMPAYQLAVVVDDARQGVTDVVRGDDLLGSAARQMLLYRLLGLGGPPRYWHVPLVMGPDGERLAKRNQHGHLSWCRKMGVPAERVVGLLAQWGGVSERNAPMTAKEFCERFDMARLSRSVVLFTEEDQQWLMNG
jgi:glutamyl-tRNA synthetase